jgi:hypothetical protein
VAGSRREWVCTGGAPLILLQENLLGDWHGTDPNLSSEDLPVVTDYERACEVQDYAGVIPVGRGSALVLGEEPMDATWWPSRDLPEGLIVRALYSPGDEFLTQLVEALRAQNLIDTGLQLMVTNPRLQLFNSAYSGTENLGPTAAVTVPIGRYSVHSAVFNEPRSHMVVVHRLVRVGDVGGAVSRTGARAFVGDS